MKKITTICIECNVPFEYESPDHFRCKRKYCSICKDDIHTKQVRFHNQKSRTIKKYNHCEICLLKIGGKEGVSQRKIHLACINSRDYKRVTKKEFEAIQLGCWDEVSVMI